MSGFSAVCPCQHNGMGLRLGAEITIEKKAEMLKRQVENYETRSNLQTSDDSVQNLQTE